MIKKTITTPYKLRNNRDTAKTALSSAGSSFISTPYINWMDKYFTDNNGGVNMSGDLHIDGNITASGEIAA